MLQQSPHTPAGALPAAPPLGAYCPQTSFVLQRDLLSPPLGHDETRLRVNGCISASWRARGLVLLSRANFCHRLAKQRSQHIRIEVTCSSWTVGALDSRLKKVAGPGLSAFNWQPWAGCSHTCDSVTKQYNLVATLQSFKFKYRIKYSIDGTNIDGQGAVMPCG